VTVIGVTGKAELFDLPPGKSSAGFKELLRNLPIVFPNKA
jgi:hypothetical protein